MKILTLLTHYYSLDLRSLSLMRIGIALVVMCDLLIRCGDMQAFYSNSGIWPSELMYNLGWQNGFWSIHGLFESDAWPWFIFALHFIFAFFLLLGFKTRFSTLVVWLLYISLHNRNVFILQSGDDLLRILLFWGLFNAWGSFYSIDAKSDKRSVFPQTFPNLGYLILLGSLYLFSALLKSSTEWHSEASALYYALSLEQMRLPLTGDLLYQFPALMKLLTHLVYYIEFLLPILILWPTKNGRTRWIAFLLILFLQLGIGLTIFVGLFFWISIVGAIALIPGTTMDKLEERFVKKKQEALPYLSHRPSLIFIVNGFCILVISIGLCINVISLHWFPIKLRKELSVTVNAIRLNQYWGMFSPGILKKDGWMVYYGIDKEGRQWDLRTNSDYVDHTKPEHVVSMYKNDRWRKLAENMQNEKFMFLRHLYSNYYLKVWNEEHPQKKMATMNLYFMEQENLLDYKKTEAKKILYCVSTAL